MTTQYAKYFSPKQTHQTQPIPGKEMIKNNASGYNFQIPEMNQMLRFLIMGAEGGTYYATESKLSAENAANTVKCIQKDTQAAVDLIVDVSINGRSAKQDAVIFALALACTFAPEDKKPIAYAAINKVCRIGTHIFQFTNFIKDLRGWSRGLRNGVSKFYTLKPLDKLELQLIKYRQREGYTHRDVMRLAHPSTKDLNRNELFKYAVGKSNACFDDVNSFRLINAYETAKKLDHKSATHAKSLINLITDSGLPREGIPTQFLNNPDVWMALLERMPIGAMVRNLGKMSAIGMTRSNGADAVIKIAHDLRNPEMVRRSRIHPMQILIALVTYSNGKGLRGSLTWSPNAKILDSLNQAFHLSFGNIEPTGLRVMEALDLSASMTWGSEQNRMYSSGRNISFGIQNSVLSPRQASTAMAMISARTEPNYDIVGFTCGQSRFTYPGAIMHGGIEPLAISAQQRLDDVIRYVGEQHAGGTDCALPMLYAAEHKIPVDLFKIHTDNETHCGAMHPKQALDKYRQKTGINAKLAVLAYSSSNNSIADPSDPGMLDVVGFDTATPNLINQFALGFES